MLRNKSNHFYRKRGKCAVWFLTDEQDTKVWSVPRGTTKRTCQCVCGEIESSGGGGGRVDAAGHITGPGCHTTYFQLSVCLAGPHPCLSCPSAYLSRLAQLCASPSGAQSWLWGEMLECGRLWAVHVWLERLAGWWGTGNVYTSVRLLVEFKDMRMSEWC